MGSECGFSLFIFWEGLRGVDAVIHSKFDFGVTLRSESNILLYWGEGLLRRAPPALAGRIEDGTRLSTAGSVMHPPNTLESLAEGDWSVPCRSPKS